MTAMINETETPRIYVACLSSYNNGRLYGKWIDATQDPDDIAEEIKEMLAASPTPGAEEYAIHDSEGFNGMLDEYDDLYMVSGLAQLIETHGADLVSGVRDHVGTSKLQWTIDAFEDNYLGSADTLADYVYEEAKDSGMLDRIPDEYQRYIDWEAVAHDRELDDLFTVEADGKTHVFSRS